jgi:hypothetical protein
MRRHVLLTMRGPLQLTAGGGGHRLPPRQRFSPFAFRSADLFREWDPAVERADRPPWGIAFPAGGGPRPHCDANVSYLSNLEDRDDRDENRARRFHWSIVHWDHGEMGLASTRHEARVW